MVDQAGERAWRRYVLTSAPVPAEPHVVRRRRQRVTIVTALVGAGALAWGLNVAPGSPWFYVATGLLAAIWVGGALASGPVHLGREPHRRRHRPVVVPIAVGLALAGVFVAGAWAVRLIPPLASLVDEVLVYARAGVGPVVWAIAVVNGIAEEVFFRGAVFDALPARFSLWGATLAYVAVTAAAGNVMLTFAAVVLGVVVGAERRVTGGILASAITHVTWSLAMLTILPRVFVVPEVVLGG